MATTTTAPGYQPGYDERLREDRTIIEEGLRDAGSRVWFLVLSLVFVFSIPTLFGLWFTTGLVGGSLQAFITLVLGLAGIGAFAWPMGKYYLINAPQLVGYVTQNMLSGKRVPYGPGLHVSFPWEDRDALGNVSLDIITRRFGEEIPVKNGKMKVTLALQYAGDIRNITGFVGVDESTIEGGFMALIRSFISAEGANVKIQSDRKKMIEKFNAGLAEKFQGITAQITAEEDPDAQLMNISEFEKRYGVHVVSIVVEGVDYDDNLQKAIDVAAKSEIIEAAVMKALGFTTKKDFREARELWLKGDPDNGIEPKTRGVSPEQITSVREEIMAQAGDAEMKIYRGLKGSNARPLVN